MIYEIVVVDTGGFKIYHSANGKLSNIMTIREALMQRFADDNEWCGDFAEVLTVSVIDTDTNTCIELEDLRINFA